MPTLPLPASFTLVRHPKLVGSLTSLASKAMTELVRRQPLLSLPVARQQAIRAKVSARRQQFDAQVLASRTVEQKQRIQLAAGLDAHASDGYWCCLDNKDASVLLAASARCFGRSGRPLSRSTNCAQRLWVDILQRQ